MHPPQFIVLLLLMLQYNYKRNQNILTDNLSRDWTRQKRLSVEVFCQIKRISFCNLSFSPSSLSTAFWPRPSSLQMSSNTEWLVCGLCGAKVGQGNGVFMLWMINIIEQFSVRKFTLNLSCRSDSSSTIPTTENCWQGFSCRILRKFPPSEFIKYLPS